ncbi:MAG: pyridoxamine 5'-phosphate oxidase family protein [Candidatus Methanomethylophilus sp.]|jgi:nitroimidazol reductase NimA-like FMN-containing flavoprotein (pyridoxamine 5'-phosphate oxidase superfamily)|nr:pyridoxamine 5'-phosphate oxidase family protein [Methanomethylophilus sp.]MCI2074412.1 pyridoxamine 5'-phosphate oxidase family protein [Methanomethylophilus sp.]MCI2092791.1 pyridoxamine 5'-phosphate oxidase family protein [Methanomethylophilus sp.]
MELQHDKPMRRADREVPAADAERILAGASFGVLSVATPDGWPYSTAVNHVYRDGRIYFHHTNSEDSLLNACLRDGARVCFTVISRSHVVPEKYTDRYESAVAFGTVRRCPDQHEGWMAICKGLSPGCGDTWERQAESGSRRAWVWEIDIEHLTGKANPVRE